jgi:hypothetical protein
MKVCHDLDTGRSVETSGARYDETGSARKIMPGPDGAHSWHPMSYSPATGLVYIPALQSLFVYKADEDFKPQPIGVNLGVNFWEPVSEINELPPEFGPDAQGHLLAWNPVTQEEVWRASHATLIHERLFYLPWRCCNFWRRPTGFASFADDRQCGCI